MSLVILSLQRQTKLLLDGHKWSNLARYSTYIYIASCCKFGILTGEKDKPSADVHDKTRASCTSFL